MPKIRQPKTSIDDKKVNDFIDGADSLVTEKNDHLVSNSEPDKNAKRDFNAIKVPFNEYEYKELEFAAEKTGRSKLNFIRYAILKESESLRSNNL